MPFCCASCRICEKLCAALAFKVAESVPENSPKDAHPESEMAVAAQKPIKNLLFIVLLQNAT
jgi:formate hydrogenlyase subunit 6/NADH:ubiquinone oxidoreductase subunit I